MDRYMRRLTVTKRKVEHRWTGDVL